MPGLPEALARPGLHLGWVWAGLWTGPRRAISLGFEGDIRKSMKNHENSLKIIENSCKCNRSQIPRRYPAGLLELTWGV